MTARAGDDVHKRPSSTTACLLHLSHDSDVIERHVSKETKEEDDMSERRCPRCSHQPSPDDVVRAVEYDGLLHLSRDPDVADDPEAHLRRAWFAVKAARAFLTSEAETTTAAASGSTGGTGATDDEEKQKKERKEIERLMCLARVWQCSDGMGCSYGPRVAQQLDDVLARLPDPWARRTTKTSTCTSSKARGGGGDGAEDAADAVRQTEAGAR